MRSLLVPLFTLLLAFYGVWGNLPAADPAEPLSVVIGQCTVDFDIRYLSRFRSCLCSEVQTCQLKIHNKFWKTSQSIFISPSAPRIRQTGSSSTHYICDVSCRRRRMIYNQVDSFTCNYVQSDEYDSQCKKGLQCAKSIHFGSTETHTARCESCVTIGWRSSDKIDVLIKNQKLVQYGQCPSESVITTGSPTMETSADLSSIRSNGSAILSTETVSKGAFRGVPVDSDVNLIKITVPLSLAIVFAFAVISKCIIFRRRSKALCMQSSGLDYITPVDVVYNSCEFLEQADPVGSQLAPNGCLQLSTLDRSSNFYSAEENAYSEVSYPGSCQIPVNQTTQWNKDSCCRNQSANEYAEATNIYTDLGETCRIDNDSNKPHYANMSLYPSDSSSIETKTTVGATCAKVKDLSQAVTNEASYSTINDCAITHNSPICESVSAVCKDTEGPYKIMKSTTNNFDENTKNRHTSDSNGAQLGNNKIYTRLQEQYEDENVYDVLATETDINFKSDLYSSIVTDDEHALVCPTHEQQCSEKNRLKGNLYENDNTRLNATGNYQVISDAMTLGIYTNRALGEDKIVEPDSTYVNCTDRGNQRAECPSTCNMNDTVTNSDFSFNGDSCPANSCVMKNNLDSNSCHDEKDNPYVEMMPPVSSSSSSSSSSTPESTS